jgi:DNA-binding MarR family transcriptional regulator
MSELDLHPTHDEAWHAFLEAHRRVTQRLEDELQDAHGIPLPWFDVLASLGSIEDHRSRMQELAQSVMISKSGLTRLVDRMERAGLLEREACEEDRRGTYATLTDQGRALLEGATPTYIRGVAEHFGELLADDEIATVAEVMGRIAEKARPDA